MTEHHYHNLGQCVGDRVVYLRSTDIEQKNWHRLLWSVPDEWLYLWSQSDNAVILHEVTSNPRGGKIKRVFAPVFLKMLWDMGFPYPGYYRGFPYSREHRVFAELALEGDPHLQTKYKFWRDKARWVDFKVREQIVAKEPNVVYALDDESKNV